MKLMIISILVIFTFFLSGENIDLKKEAFKVLESKCNACHQLEKRKVFTLENMDAQAKKINKQVFVKKKMPKGDDIKLTSEEYSLLKECLLSLDIHQK